MHALDDYGELDRNLDTGDGFCGGDMGGSIEAISDCDASTFAMREADLAAMSLDQLQLQMSQQQQQHHQQQHLMDAVSMRLQQQQQQVMTWLCPKISKQLVC